jgi:hypothetical protein
MTIHDNTCRAGVIDESREVCHPPPLFVIFMSAKNYLYTKSANLEIKIKSRESTKLLIFDTWIIFKKKIVNFKYYNGYDFLSHCCGL